MHDPCLIKKYNTKMLNVPRHNFLTVRVWENLGDDNDKLNNEIGLEAQKDHYI